ncbi:hypothetical protein [Actinomadura sp. 6N118]|uniref:hypothetical protein n=1 Tax=Actinomadura sp. 6N118 TaxID=3375151 RepID=UPI00379F3546
MVASAELTHVKGPRPNRRPHRLLQGRVQPGIKERAERGAAARGVSITRYLELLIEADELADAAGNGDMELRLRTA